MFRSCWSLSALFAETIIPSCWPYVAPGVFGLCDIYVHVTVSHIFVSFVIGFHLAMLLGRAERTGLAYVNRVVPVLGYYSS